MPITEQECQRCAHRCVCEILTCNECSGGFDCSDCTIYVNYEGNPKIADCKCFLEEKI